MKERKVRHCTLLRIKEKKEGRKAERKREIEKVCVRKREREKEKMSEVEIKNRHFLNGFA